VSSVDSSKTVNGLSDSEAKEYCQDASRFSANNLSGADAKKMVCGFTAAAFGAYGAANDQEAKTKCQEHYNSCLNEPEKNDSDAGTESDPCADFKTKAANCSATVGEVNQCLSDQAALIKSLASKDFCGEAKANAADSPTSGGSTPETPASCKALQTKCPGMFGDDSSDSTEDSSSSG
jgi:hypothetical protein